MHGAEVRAESMVTRIEVDERTGRATGVHYVKDGVSRFQRARMVAIAGYSIETPRLLLNSASKRFPDGLCNDFDQVGRYLMVQGAPQTAGRFDAEIRMYKSPPPEVSSEEFYETDPAKPYRRGFAIQTVSPLPITWAEHVAAQGHWGASLREYMSDYVHWSCLGALCEFLAQPDNRVTLAQEKDRYGLPVAHFAYSQCDNDQALMKAARSVMEDLLHAAGADEVITIDRFAHLVGGARMAKDEQHGVVNADCRSFAVPNLYITDGSVLPTQGSANPALTIMAVAALAGDELVKQLGCLGEPVAAPADSGPRVAGAAELAQPTGDGTQREPPGSQPTVRHFIPVQRDRDRRAWPRPHHVGRHDRLGVGVAHDVEVYPAAALVFALLGGHQAGMPGGQQATGLASERAHRVEVIRGVQRHVDVQSLAAGRLDEGRQAEFAFEQVPQRERGLPDLVELVGIRRAEIEHQLVRVLEPAEPAEKDMQLNAGLVSQVDQGGGLVADDMPHGTVLLAYLRARLTQSRK